MRNFNNILYASHATADETEGLKQALSLARGNDAALRVLVVAPPMPKELQEFRQTYEDALLEQAKESVAKTKQALCLEDPQVELAIGLVSDEKPSIRIIQEVLRGRHDLLIKEAEVPGRGEGFWAIDMALLRKCPCPVWLSRPIERHRQDIRVAVAVDPESSDGTARALAVNLIRFARTLADASSGKLEILACTHYAHEQFMRNNPWVKMASTEVDRAIASAMASQRKLLDELIAEAGGAGEHELHHVRGEAARLIPAFVDRFEIDVLVMGTVARSGIPGLLLGNTAENLAQSVRSSVIALKPADFVSPIKLG